MRYAILLALLIALPLRGDGFVTLADGARIHYLERKPATPAARTFVFVPGWMLPGDVWRAQLAHFGKRHRAVAIDPRSQGDSTKTSDGNYPAQRARDLRAVIEKLALRNIVLVGATSGVTDVVAYVDQFGTDRITAVILVHGVPGADWDPNVTPNLFRWAQRFQTDRRAQTEALVRSLFSKPADAAVVRELTQKAMKMPTAAAIASFFGLFASDYRPSLAKIDKPTLIVVGKNSWAAYYEAMHKAVKGSRLEVLENAGHALYLEDPARFNAAVEGFLRGPAADLGGA